MILAAAAVLQIAACSDAGPLEPAGEVPVASVTIEPEGPLSLDAGAVVQLQVSVRAATDSLLTDRTVVWSSSNPAVATLSDGGSLAALAPGLTRIVAEAGNRADTLDVIVLPAHQDVARMELLTEGLVTLHIGMTRQLGVRLFADDGTELFDRTVTWSSDTDAIASVNAAGIVKAHEVGAAVVTAAVDGVTAAVAIDVRSTVAAVSVGTGGGLPEIAVGDQLQLTAVLRTATGETVRRPITWSSSNPAVALVDATGRVSGVAAGSATIVATSDNQQGWIMVTVGAWSSRSLQTVDGAAPPLVLWTTEHVDSTMTTVTATSGTLRLAMTGVNSGRFEQLFAVIIKRGANVPQYATYSFGGTYTYQPVTNTLTLSGYSGQALTAELLPGGGMRVTGRLDAGRPSRQYLYGAQP
jgi:uncharacterized protein YjdB